MFTFPLKALPQVVSWICFSALLVLAASPASAQTLTVLYSFAGPPDAAYPFGGLVRDAKGNLYGATAWGGTTNNGAVFAISKRGVEKVLYSFQGGTDGAYPSASLVRDKAGNLYGTTPFGGDSTSCSNGCGTIFQITPAGDESVLYRFTGGSDGSKPQAALILDRQGNLYGTTSEGGFFFWGTVFKLSPDGQLTTLYAFTGDIDGGGPMGALVRDSKGNLYGTTQFMGAQYAGTVFKVSKSGIETVLYSFAGGSDGEFPQTGVVRDKQGNLYGTTPIVGSNFGTVYEITTRGKYHTLYIFTGQADGAGPVGGVIRDTKGNLYGTVSVGGADGFGAVFKLTP